MFIVNFQTIIIRIELEIKNGKYSVFEEEVSEAIVKKSLSVLSQEDYLTYEDMKKTNKTPIVNPLDIELHTNLPKVNINRKH